MIRFDNGPPDGDYVRYIDALMAQRAAALVSPTMTSTGDGVERTRADASRKGSTARPALSPAAAGAIASAMATGDDQRREVLAIGATLRAAAIAAGAVLILIGVLGPTANVLFIVGGIALISWAIKRFGRSAAPRVAAAAADAFAHPAVRRTASRIERKG